jgi:exodeoxyribonuclease VII small subunit
MAAKRPAPSSQPPSFEKALEELESIVTKIESGQIGLEESIAEYERGVALVQRCREVLAKAEQRVADLTARMSEPDKPAGKSA